MSTRSHLDTHSLSPYLTSQSTCLLKIFLAQYKMATDSRNRGRRCFAESTLWIKQRSQSQRSCDPSVIYWNFYALMDYHSPTTERQQGPQSPRSLGDCCVWGYPATPYTSSIPSGCSWGHQRRTMKRVWAHRSKLRVRLGLQSLAPQHARTSRYWSFPTP